MVTVGRIHLANVLELQNDYAGAVEHNQRAAAILEATVGTASPDYAKTVLNICELEVDRKRPREALTACARGLPMLERALGPDHPVVAQALVTIVSLAYAVNGKPREASAALDRGIAIWPKNDQRREATIAEGEQSLATAILEHSPRDRAIARAVATRARNRLRDAGAGHEAGLAEADAWLASHRQ
jgi:eukaryotic-like serine/threonine-protein kinase